MSFVWNSLSRIVSLCGFHARFSYPLPLRVASQLFQRSFRRGSSLNTVFVSTKACRMSPAEATALDNEPRLAPPPHLCTHQFGRFYARSSRTIIPIQTRYFQTLYNYTHCRSCCLFEVGDDVGGCEVRQLIMHFLQHGTAVYTAQLTCES